MVLFGGQLPWRKLCHLIEEQAFSGVISIRQKEQIKTVTFDNGKEFSEREKLSEVIGALCYFAKPYHSWERGLNEHTNGLLRQFFSKEHKLQDSEGRRGKEGNRFDK
jgi:IS30 family transposase